MHFRGNEVSWDTTSLNSICSEHFGDLRSADLPPLYAEKYRDWTDAHERTGLPPRSMVDPSWLGRLVSSSVVFQVEGEDLRHRICGETFLDRNGRFDPTGTTVGELARTRPVARLLLPLYQRVIRDGVPALIGLRYLTVKQNLRNCDLLVLPFGSGESGAAMVRHILTIYNFLQDSRTSE